jgi:hypothetical protein
VWFLFLVTGRIFGGQLVGACIGGFLYDCISAFPSSCPSVCAMTSSTTKTAEFSFEECNA